MFRRCLKSLARLLPFTIAVSSHVLYSPFVFLDSRQVESTYPSKVKVVSDIGEYVEKDSDPKKAVLIC